MMFADHPEKADSESELEHERVATSIRDAEIAQIAVFKLRECAARMETLADAGQGSQLCEELRNMGQKLREMESALFHHARQG